MRQVLVILFLCLGSAFSFSGSDSLLSYYPLQIGNYWEYEDKFVDLLNDTTVIGYFSFSVTGDTIMPNGKLYQIVKREKLTDYKTPKFDFDYGNEFYDRLDSVTYNIYRFDSGDLDRQNDELLLDSLVLVEGEFDGFSRWIGIPAIISNTDLITDSEKFDSTEIKSYWANDMVSWGFYYSLANRLGFVYGYLKDTTWRHSIDLV